MTFPFVIDPVHMNDFRSLRKRLIGDERSKHEAAELVKGNVMFFGGLSVATASSLYLAIAVHPAAWLLTALTLLLWISIATAVARSRSTTPSVPPGQHSGELSITENGIAWRFEDASVIEVDWSGFTSWLASDVTVLLRNSAGTCHIIPLPPGDAGRQVLGRLHERLQPPILT